MQASEPAAHVGHACSALTACSCSLKNYPVICPPPPPRMRWSPSWRSAPKVCGRLRAASAWWPSSTTSTCPPRASLGSCRPWSCSSCGRTMASGGCFASGCGRGGGGGGELDRSCQGQLGAAGSTIVMPFPGTTLLHPHSSSHNLLHALQQVRPCALRGQERARHAAARRHGASQRRPQRLQCAHPCVLRAARHARARRRAAAPHLWRPAHQQARGL